MIDFAGSLAGVTSMTACSSEFMALLRGAKRPPAVVLIDRTVGAKIDGPVVVRDHINLTGSNPLLGPNHPSGERFPVVQGIYVDDCLRELPRVVAAGLKPGIKPTAEDLELVKRYGADVCCYHAVPAMLVAAHARCRVLAILLPEGAQVSVDLLKQIRTIVGDVA